MLGFSRQAFNVWRAQPVSQRDWDGADLVDAILDIHAATPSSATGSSPTSCSWPVGTSGRTGCKRLCAEHAIFSTTTRKGRRGSGKQSGPAVHDDHVQRDFTAERPDQLWLTDITEHPTAEGKLYVCAIKDACSNRIVGHATGPRMTAQLAVSALRIAVARRGPVEQVIVHSDRGSQFRSRKFRAVRADAGLLGSMGWVASAGDNAAIKSFFSLLQKNVLDRRSSWASREDLQVAIITWIERTCNRRRRQRGLGRLTPVEFELLLSDRSQALAA